MILDRRLSATLCTLTALALGLTLAARRDQAVGSGSSPGGAPPARPSAEPRDVFWQMVESSREGDVDTYLDAFAGELADQLSATRGEMGDAAFALYLRRRYAELKGVAVTDEEELDDGIRLRVEYVYASTYEAQDLEIRDSGGGWRIVGAGATRRQQSLIPYGTPIGPND